MRMMGLLLGLAGLLGAGAAAANGTLPEYEIDLAGQIEVAPDGSVHAWSIESKALKPAVAKALEAQMRQWTFEPIDVDGRPVIARTRWRVTLEAQPVGENLALRVAHVYFGEPSRAGRMEPPRFPPSAARSGVGAKVVLILKLDEAGRVTDVHAEQTSLSPSLRSDASAERWRRRFVEASSQAAKQWTFEIGEIVDGKPADTSVRVPVVFIPPGLAPEGWQAFVPGPRVPAPWADEAGELIALEDLEEGDLRPLNPRFKLRSEVVGSLL